MKKIEYQCDLCRELYSEKEAKENIFSMYWGFSDTPPIRELYIFKSYNANCDKHICQSCVDLIKTTDFTTIKN